jgi:hypothetical protein
MRDEAYIARCDAERERLHQKIRDLGALPPDPVSGLREPHADAKCELDFAVSEFRRELVERKGEELRAALSEILSAELLAKLDAAKATDNRVIDAGVRLGFLRLLHDLFAEPDVGKPNPPPRQAPKRKAVENDDEDDVEVEEEIGCPIHLEDILGEEPVHRVRLDMPQRDLEYVHAALGCWLRALRDTKGPDIPAKIAEAEVLQRRIGDELEPLLEAEISELIDASYKVGATVLLDHFGDPRSIQALIFTRDSYRFALDLD